MIEKERLEELIKEDATICNQYIDYNNNICYRFGKASIIQDNDEQHIELKLNGTNTSIIMFDTKYLFETKEDAEFALKYQNITRTETLNLPTFEDFVYLDIPFEFYARDGETYWMEIWETNTLVIFKKIGFASCIFEKPLTKENYYAACALCRKLFLGEEV